jgi:hypothetical protein
MNDLALRHLHVCEECGRAWECFLPGGCREEKEKDCRYCTEDEEEGEE